MRLTAYRLRPLPFVLSLCIPAKSNAVMAFGVGWIVVLSSFVRLCGKTSADSDLVRIHSLSMSEYAGFAC